MHGTTSQRRRAVYFTGGLLAGMVLLGQQFVAQQSRTSLGERVTPPGWLFSYRVPDGWQDDKPRVDLIGYQQRTYADRDEFCLLSFGRLDITSDTTPATLSDWAARQLRLERELHAPPDLPSRLTSLGPLSARIVEWSLDSEQGQPIFRARVLAAVAENDPSGRAGYTITLISAGRVAARHERIWAAVVESIVFAEGQK